MYHDEFRKTPARTIHRPDVPLSSFPLELGGGLSLGLAASLNPAISMFLYQVGGLLPLVACSVEIAGRRLADFVLGLVPRVEIERGSTIPVPHLRRRSRAVAGSRIGRLMTRSAR